MKFRGDKSLTPEDRLLNVIYRRGRRPGCAETTLGTILKQDPQALLRCSRPILSLDYAFETPDGEYASLGARLDSSGVVFPEGKPKTLLDEIHEKDVLELIKRVRQEIRETWRKKYAHGRPGIKLAVKVFEGLCDNDTQAEIARNLNVSRERVRQLQGQLQRLPVVKRMGRELRAMQSDANVLEL